MDRRLDESYCTFLKDRSRSSMSSSASGELCCCSPHTHKPHHTYGPDTVNSHHDTPTNHTHRTRQCQFTHYATPTNHATPTGPDTVTSHHATPTNHTTPTGPDTVTSHHATPTNHTHPQDQTLSLHIMPHPQDKTLSLCTTPRHHNAGCYCATRHFL